MFEIEQKFHIDDLADLQDRLRDLGGQEQAVQKHCDTYYNHPNRDFAQTHEALRVRRIDGVPMITYKGAKLPGAIKARRELEWRLDPGDPDGTNTEELLQILGFRRVATVEKIRRDFQLPLPATNDEDQTGDVAKSAVLGVVIDQVESLGSFAEVELIVENSSQVEHARSRIAELSGQLGLHRSESRSYLEMILALDAD